MVARSKIFFADCACLVSVDGQVVDGPDSTVPVTATSRVVLCRRHGPVLDVLTRGVVRRICLN
jgi:hypothetical protein